MNERMIRADRTLRKKVIIWAVFFGLAGVLIIQVVYSAFDGLESLAETDPEQALSSLKKILTAITVTNAFGSSLFAFYFVSVAARILASGRYPPPGMRVLRDTRVRTGKKAKWMAAAQILAALLILATNIGMWFLHRIVEGIGG